MVTLGLSLDQMNTLDAAASREWLLTDGLGGFAMGTVAGLRTRSQHSLLTVRQPGSSQRKALLLGLDPVVTANGRHELATREWSTGQVAPAGHQHLIDFRILDQVPHWRWLLGSAVVEQRMVMAHGRRQLVWQFEVIAAELPVALEVEVILPEGSDLLAGTEGFSSGELQVRGLPFSPSGILLGGIHYRQEAARGLPDTDQVLLAGRFHTSLATGQVAELVAWVGPEDPLDGAEVLASRRGRSVHLVEKAGFTDHPSQLLVQASDQFVISPPDVLAGFPWFGAWSRDTLTAYEGTFLVTNRWDEGAALLTRLASSLSQGMLANTADWGEVEYNSVDAPMWFLYVAGRHLSVTGDLAFAATLLPALEQIVANYRSGTRYGIRVEADGLVTNGTPGMALTWMDARVGGVPITPRVGKPVEVNALWVAGLWHLIELKRRLDLSYDDELRLHQEARKSFRRRFPAKSGLHDVIDGPDGDDATLRPNQLLAVSLRHGPFAGPDGIAQPELAKPVLAACWALLTPLGPRSLAPGEPGYAPRFTGDMTQRDSIYHQGTVWPWLIGAFADTVRACGGDPMPYLGGLIAHLADAGLGSVTEVADAEVPQLPGGCSFQAWSVAELLRALHPLP